MKTKHHLTPDLIRLLYIDQGKTLQEIADEYGCSLKVVWNRCNRWGIPRRPGCANWKGGILFDKSGYVLIHQPHHPHCDNKGYVREHRLVMEKKIGRFLLQSEVVHHKDDNPQNNDPDNLELFASNKEHLAATLRGKVPNWTDDGLRRMQQGLDKIRCKQLPPPEEIAKLYETMSADEIARHFGCSQRPVADRLRAAGVNLRSNKDRFSHKWPTIDEAREMLSKMTPVEMAKKIGRKEKSLYAWLSRNGVSWRHRTHCSKSPQSTSTEDQTQPLYVLE